MRDLQRVIGDEARRQALEAEGSLPARVIACVGGGSNAIGAFTAFLEDDEVELVGVEAAGEGLQSGRHGASLGAGRTGVLHGSLSAVISDEDGQILEAHSISAGLDYPGVGPEHAQLRDSGRARYESVTDRDALLAFRELARLEGIIPALEPAHAIAWVLANPGQTGSEQGGQHPGTPGSGAEDVPGYDLVCLSRPRRQGPRRSARGRWRASMADAIGTSTGLERIEAVFAGAREEGRAALMPYMMGGFPDREGARDVARAYADAGADMVELGIPFSDPLADGPVIHAAATAALAQGADLDAALEASGVLGEGVPSVAMCYVNMILALGPRRFAGRLAAAGAAGAIVPDLPLEESEEIGDALAAEGLALVPLVAPTTPPERRRRICEAAGGFVYVVSVAGVTGERDEIPPHLAELVGRRERGGERAGRGRVRDRHRPAGRRGGGDRRRGDHRDAAGARGRGVRRRGNRRRGRRRFRRARFAPHSMARMRWR